MNQKEFFWISVTIFLTILSWMILDIYRVKKEVTVQSELNTVQTVDFKINPDILDKIKEKNP